MIGPLLVGAALAAGTPEDGAAAVQEELASIEAPAGTNVWDRAVAFHLLVAYDRNGSGAIDRRREVDAIPCDVLTAIDTALAEQSQYPGVLATYGFDRDLVWLGGYLGFHKRVRGAARRRMESCGITPEGPHSDFTVDHELGGVIAGMLSVLPDPGSPEWADHTRSLLVRTYDLDGSERIDTPVELRSVSCIVWRMLDDVFSDSEGEGVVDALGLRADLPWGGDRIGLSEVVAPEVHETARRCGLRDAGR